MTPPIFYFTDIFPDSGLPTPCNMYSHRQVSSRASLDLLDLQMGKTVFLSLPSIRMIPRELCWAKVTLSNQRKSTSSNALTGTQYGGVLLSHKEGKSFRCYITAEPWGRDVCWKKKGRREWTDTVTFWRGPSHICSQQDRGFGGLVGGEGEAAAYWAQSLLLGGESDCEVAQSCLTLCNLTDCSLPGSSLHGILQARILDWIAILFSKISLYRLLKMRFHMSDICFPLTSLTMIISRSIHVVANGIIFFFFMVE